MNELVIGVIACLVFLERRGASSFVRLQHAQVQARAASAGESFVIENY